LTALPETILLQVAKGVEYVSLTSSRVVSAFLWPLHNSLLSLWMLTILWLTVWTAAWDSLQILVWGGRRTGISLSRVYQDKLGLTTQCISGMCEPHQAITCRLVGLVLLPLPTTLNFLKGTMPMSLGSAVFVFLLLATSWYWWLVVPWLSACLVGAALASGACFALIEFAGV
jgi:hypothetical protein